MHKSAIIARGRTPVLLTRILPLLLPPLFILLREFEYLQRKIFELLE